MKYTVKLNQKIYEVEIERSGNQPAAMGESARVPSVSLSSVPIPSAPALSAQAPSAQPPVFSASVSGGADIQVESPMPGKVLSIAAAVGQQVAPGDCLVVIEAMKMENEIVAPQAGTVKQILVSPGTAVDTGDILAVIK